jgi:hypothetical protein
MCKLMSYCCVTPPAACSYYERNVPLGAWSALTLPPQLTLTLTLKEHTNSMKDHPCFTMYRNYTLQ